MAYDFCVVGGGIVGLATAVALLERHPGASLILLEKEATLGLHQTGRNSGVIHSGIYYAPGSLKARLCKAGAARTKAYCTARNIPFEDRGKLIVATNELEESRLGALAERAVQNEVAAERLTAEEITEREPNVTGRAALFVPAAAIVDYGKVLAALARDVEAAGGEIVFGAAPEAIRERAGDVEIGLADRAIEARILVACAGLQSDRVARLAGMPTEHQIVPFRGEYYQLPAERQHLTHAMIYPVPDPDLPFLGLHLTPMIDGRITLGPNAVLGFAREGYDKWTLSPRDVMAYGRFPGFWRTIAKNWRAGIEEMGNSLSKRRYLAACQKYCPSLRLEDLQPSRTGIRAQAVLNDGTLVQDFLFLQSERMLHVCNAPSPAATSALPIGDMIAEQIEPMMRQSATVSA